MTSKEAFDIIVRYVPTCFKDELETIEKDLEMLDCFKKLFEGEDLHSWIEFDFSADYKNKRLNDSDYTGWISTMLKIRKYLEDEEKK